jgi:hypothetical protein
MAAASLAAASAKSPPGNLSVSTAILLSPNADRRVRHPSTTCFARSRRLTIFSAPSSSTGAGSWRMRTVGCGCGSSGGGAWVASKSSESERDCEARRGRRSAWDGAVKRQTGHNGSDCGNGPPMSRTTAGAEPGRTGWTRHGWSKSAKGSKGRRGRKTEEEFMGPGGCRSAACLYNVLFSRIRMAATR